MASFYLLPIDDPIAGPALELLRRLIQPESRSLPHITVRYSRTDSSLPTLNIYDEFIARSVTLLEPTSFQKEASQAAELSTMFLRCMSDQLEYLQYKPDFPTSVFHITIYDGPPSSTAALALKVMREFQWDLDVELPRTRLVGAAHKLPKDGPRLSPEAGQLATNLQVELDLQDSEIGPAVRRICRFLHSNLKRTHLHRGGPTDRSAAASASGPQWEQAALWSRLELMDSSARLSLERDRLRRQKRTGSFMTPPEVAYDIVKAVSKFVGGRDVNYGDPSFGGGIFLAALLRQIGTARVRSVVAVESDPNAAGVALDRWARPDFTITVADFLSEILSNRVPQDRSESTGDHWVSAQPDLVVTNPPYVRSQALDDEDAANWRSVIEAHLGIRLSPRTDLYAYFVLASHFWLADNAVAAWLLPTEFMFTNYGAALRKYLTHSVDLQKVHLYDGPSVFANARVNSCVVFYRNRPAEHSSIIEFSAGGSIDSPIVSHAVRNSALRGSDKWHRIADEGAPPAPAASRAPEIADFFRVRRGVATGANRLLTVSNETFLAFGPTAASYFKPLLPRAHRLPGPVVEADDHGNPRLAECRWLIDTNASLEEIETVCKPLAAYLRSIEREVLASTLASRRRPFYRMEQNEPAQFFFSYMSRNSSPSRRFYLNRSRAVALNNYLVLTPRLGLRNWLSSKPGRDMDVLSALRAVDERAVEREGRPYVEGLTKIEPRELGRLPFELRMDGVAGAGVSFL